ncbi:DUF1643 domain-containing protein [Marivita sp. S2033]|uniref:DUF1643 domain-containing protein n=1 Tax=Marivita sp. S2033 TaxID=3373187 RepID=UPI003981F0A0
MTDLPANLCDRLVCRTHEGEDCVSRVWYSPCGHYRYGLSRLWNADQRSVLFIMLNPSTADEHRNDPTVARCETRARRMGFGAVMIANIFAFRATKPADLKRAAEPVGPFNDAVLEHWSDRAGLIIAAWGAHGAYQGRALTVARRLPAAAHHLGLTKHGHPRHPLYVSFDTAPVAWQER